MTLVSQTHFHVERCGRFVVRVNSLWEVDANLIYINFLISFLKSVGANTLIIKWLVLLPDSVCATPNNPLESLNNGLSSYCFTQKPHGCKYTCVHILA